jgi:hypothetical protein
MSGLIWDSFLQGLDGSVFLVPSTTTHRNPPLKTAIRTLATPSSRKAYSATGGSTVMTILGIPLSRWAVILAKAALPTVIMALLRGDKK